MGVPIEYRHRFRPLNITTPTITSPLPPSLTPTSPSSYMAYSRLTQARSPATLLPTQLVGPHVRRGNGFKLGPSTKLVKGKWVPNAIADGAWNKIICDGITAARPNIDPTVYTSHGLRSGAATSLVENGGSLDDARQLLGHRSEQAVACYVKSNIERRRKIASSTL
jgi:integrase